MNRCTELDIQEMLPDLLHGKLDARGTARVEAHVASCEECREDLEVLRTVKSAAVFVPAIDAERVVRQIGPYRTMIPPREVPARSRAAAWLVAASLVLVVASGGSVLLMQQNRSDRPTRETIDSRVSNAAAGPESLGPVVIRGGVPLQERISTTPAATHALALATGVDGLSDNNLRQLMTDMDTFDALPATEPEPVISVDNGDGLEQGSR